MSFANIKNAENMLRLKRHIRAVLHEAVADSQINSDEALGILMDLSSEFVGKIKDDESRNAYVSTVTEMFPVMVEMTRTPLATAIVN